jgi:hypothetical protein
MKKLVTIFIILPSLAFATMNEATIYHSSQGCMSCHQAEAVQRHSVQKNRHQSHHPVKNVRTR